MSSRVSTTVGTAVVPEGVRGLAQQPGHHREPAAVTAGPLRLAHLVVEREPEQVAPHRVVVRRGGGRRALVEVPLPQQVLAAPEVATLQAYVEQVRHQDRRHRVEVVELESGHLVDRQVALGLELLADPLRAVAVVPVVGEEVGVRRVGHRLVRGDHEPLVGVEHRRQRVERHERLAPVVLRQPPRRRQPAVVAGLPDRDLPRRLVADVALGVGVDEVLRRHREVGGSGPELVPVRGPVELQDRVGGGGRLERGPLQRHGEPVARVGTGRRLGVRADGAQLTRDVGEQRAVLRGPDGQVEVVAAEHLDRLGPDRPADASCRRTASACRRPSPGRGR